LPTADSCRPSGFFGLPHGRRTVTRSCPVLSGHPPGREQARADVSFGAGIARPAKARDRERRFCQQGRIQFSKVATSEQAAFMAAIKARPSVWAATSADKVGQFRARCAPDAKVALVAADDYALGVTPHDESVPGCHATSTGP
jgi:hypothetical protein